MCRRKLPRALVITGVIVMAMVIMTGCGNKPPTADEISSGFSLKYRMPSGQTLKYRTSSGFTQTMSVEDRSVEVTADETKHFTVKPKGQREGKYQLNVTIDSVDFSLGIPSGNLSANTSAVKGRSFPMSLTSAGRELGLFEAEPIEYELIPGQTQNIIHGFQALFPDLPKRSLKVGDTWTTIDTVIEKTSMGELNMVFENRNRLDGFETVNGMECARIISDVKGTIDGVSHALGVDLNSSGIITGTDIWYFAYRKGIFVKMKTTGTGESTISGSTPKEISIPVRREYAMETILLK